MPRANDAAGKSLCDLHTHSVYSDGTMTPEQLLSEADKLGLGALALTDHNTVSGIPAFLQAAKEYDLLPVAGVELSTVWQGCELHILGLFLPEDSLPALTRFTDDYNRRKARSNENLILALQRAGYPVDYEELCHSHGEGSINRANIAAMLVKKGCVRSVKEAFQGLLSKKGGFYVPPERPQALETISYLRSLGCVPVLAHPFLNLQEEKLRRFLPEAAGQGLAAMEVLYSTFSPEQTALAVSMARESGLLPSGGSDFHGGNKPDISLGCGRGNLQIPMSLALELKHKQQSYTGYS